MPRFTKSTFTALYPDEAIREKKIAPNQEFLNKSNAGKEGRKVWMSRLDIRRINSG